MITWNFPPKYGGMENLLYDIYSHLSKKYKIAVLAPAPGGEEKHLPDIYRPRKGGFFYFVVFSIVKGLRLLVGEKADIAFGGSLTVLPVLAVLKCFFRIPCVVYAHGLDIIYDNFLYQAILRICIPMMDGIICNSVNTRELLLQKFGKTGYVAVIPPGVESDCYPPNTDRPHCRRYLLSVGRLVPRKGLVAFIERSFRHIAEEYDDVDFLIAGEEPDEAMYHRAGYKQEILDCVYKQGLQKRVHLLGWVAEKQKFALYQYCECLVFPVIPTPGDVEGFGIVAIETGLMGRPTVAFDTGGIKDAVLDESGVLVAPGDYEAMTGAIQMILENRRFCDPAKITAAVKNRYCWDNLMPAYADFFQSVSR